MSIDEPAASAARWRPSGGPAARRRRAALLRFLRLFFLERDVLEVETPLLSAAATTDPNLTSVAAGWPGYRGWLQTSPEYPMKRLLAAGEGDLYQICKVFRAAELGRHHNPEFSLLEWYRHGFDDRALAAEVVSLIELAATAIDAPQRPNGVLWRSYAEWFDAAFGIDILDVAARPDVPANRSALAAACMRAGGGEDATAWSSSLQIDWLTSRAQALLPAGRLTVITGFPASQAVLARVNADDPRVAERFEVFWGTLELANGYHELSDVDELLRRQAHEQAQRTRAGAVPVPVDVHLIAAQRAGLPDCAGVALGVDRLLMALTGAESIAEVIDFPLDRA